MPAKKRNSGDEHDRLAWRLTQILKRLNQGQRLNPHELAEEFKVTLRTMQRDLCERFGFLDLQKTNGKYHLAPSQLGKLNLQDLERFASLAGVQGLFPALTCDFLRELLDQRLESALQVRGPQFEDMQGRQTDFKILESAIKERRSLSFVYTKAALVAQAPVTKTYEPIHPYKLVNHGGVWYLAAEHEGKLKAFAFSKIERLLPQGEPFQPKLAIQQTLQQEDSIWLNLRKTEVVLKVAPPAADYFKRRKLVSGQSIDKELEDGGLIISTQIAHPNQILPIVRYWLPHVRIISPEGLQAELECEMKGYLAIRTHSALEV